MQAEEPPILPVGTAVSAKYKGAFCEAKVSRVNPQLKYRVSYKEPHFGTETLREEHVKGSPNVRVGQTVSAWHHGQKTYIDAQIMRIQDQSQYTVVFDDGDITTLRRNYLCLKSGRHFNESETLDQLPLTHPEHFSNPVVGGRTRRRNRNRGDDSDLEQEEGDPELESYLREVGKVVTGENTDKKRHKDWCPGLITFPKSLKSLNAKEEYLIRSFTDGRFYNVPKKDVIEFNKEIGEKLERINPHTPFWDGVQKAMKYLNTGELPAYWEKTPPLLSGFNEPENEFNFSDSSDDEQCEEKDRFVAQLYKFLDEAGTPLNDTPTVGGEHVDLYRLFSLVTKLGGYNKVCNNNKWRSISLRLKLGSGHSGTNQVKQVYKKCLLSFEPFYKTLGVTMSTNTKSNKKNKGRSLIRDKDRATPINSPKPDKDDEDKKDEEKVTIEEKDKKKRPEIKEEKKKKDSAEVSDSGDTTDNNESSTSKDPGRAKRLNEPIKPSVKDKKPKQPTGEKLKTESQVKKEEGQQTRSKSQLTTKTVAPKKSESKTKETKDVKDSKATLAKVAKKLDDDKEKTKRANKRSQIEIEGVVDNPAAANVAVGDKLKVYYGPTIESKITYEAKVVEIDNDGNVPLYLVHYTGWNTRYDEWIGSARIAENLSAFTKSKKIKLGTPNPGVPASSKPSASSPAGGKSPVKRKRGPSVTRRTSINELQRSTTPLSSTSNSSRPKTPATPATRSTTRGAKQEEKRSRRTSVQTDTSVLTDTESPVSESEPELTRTRSGGGKSDEPEVRVYKKRAPKFSVLNKVRPKPREDDDDTEKEDEAVVERPKRTKKRKKSSEKVMDESDDDLITLPKGRDFDLNQIRSELKGFSKAVPATNSDSPDKDTSSDDSTKQPIPVHITAEEDEESIDVPKDLKKEIDIAKSSSEDIYEFKEPEPFEFETRTILGEDKTKKRRFFDDPDKSPKGSKSPTKTQSNDSDVDDGPPVKKVSDDPFDKLVESPCFNMVKSAEKQKNVMDEAPSTSLFKETPETTDDCSGDMELSDTESQTQPIFTPRPTEEAFSDAFTKSSSEQNTLDMEFPKSEDRNVVEVIKASIQRMIERGSSTEDEDDTRDALQITLPVTSYSKKSEPRKSPIPSIASVTDVVDTEKSAFGLLKRMSPVLNTAEKESTTSLLEIIKTSKVKEDMEEIKKEEEEEKVDVVEKLEKPKTDDEEKVNVMEDTVETSQGSIDVKVDVEDEETETGDTKDPSLLKAEPDDLKKRKKVVSRPFVESDSDSTDSDNLVIARSEDDESQTNSVIEPEKLTFWGKNQSSTNATEESMSALRDEEERNFKFEKLPEKEKENEEEKTVDVQIDSNQVEVKETTKDDEEEEETDAHLHDILLCEETIPRSPAPVTETTPEEPVRRSKSAMEMPFASVPGSSNNKSILLNSEPVKLHQSSVLVLQKDNLNVAKSPVSTPESSLSNLSPRDNNGGLSPDSRDIESATVRNTFEQKRDNATKLSPFSEEDSQTACDLNQKERDDTATNTSSKKRKPLRTSESSTTKRGRRRATRSRSDSDDDMSDHSLTSSNTQDAVPYRRQSNSERPARYDFSCNLDGITDRRQRINIILQKMADLRKTYVDVKAELAEVERKRKKIKRRQREAMKMMKQATMCA